MRDAKRRIVGVTLCNIRLSYKTPCHSIVGAKVFWLKKFFDTFAQEKYFVSYRIEKYHCVLLMEKVSELQIMGSWVALHW